MNTPRSRPIRRFPQSIKQPSNRKHRPWRDGGVTYEGMIRVPIYAEALGQIVSQWAHLEEQMIAVLAKLLGDVGPHAARQIFRSVNSAQARIDIMRSLLEESPINQYRGQVFDEVIDEFQSLTSERNKCAHGLWWTTDHQEIVRSDPSETASLGGPLQGATVALQQLNDLLRRMDRLYIKIQNEIHGIPWPPSARPNLTPKAS